jgi:hypothetical protein
MPGLYNNLADPAAPTARRDLAMRAFSAYL